MREPDTRIIDDCIMNQFSEDTSFKRILLNYIYQAFERYGAFQNAIVYSKEANATFFVIETEKLKPFIEKVKNDPEVLEMFELYWHSEMLTLDEQLYRIVEDETVDKCIHCGCYVPGHVPEVYQSSRCMVTKHCECYSCRVLENEIIFQLNSVYMDKGQYPAIQYREERYRKKNAI